ncbi:MAG: hypothetical protein HYV96_20430 [Opitutae bacterium]|nr:hypothetical protein [Opitutae bacterium]
MTSDGGATVTQRGIVYSTAQNPTTSSGTFVTAGSGTGSFSTVLNGPLSPGTTYYVRAFATNSAGTAYGDQINFTTSIPVTSPTVTTTAASSVNATGATLGGNVTSDGGATVTQRGIVYSTAQNPTTSSGTFVTVGSGTGSFSTVLNGPLSPGTTYYVRAFATNFAGTAYGDQINFTTPTENHVLFADDFSGTLSGWTAMPSDAGASWQIQNGNLIGDYTIGAGSSFNTQGFLLLNDANQPSGDWSASVDFTVVNDLTDPAFKSANVGFGLWVNESSKLNITLGYAQWDWTVGPRTTVDVSVSRWTSFWDTVGLERTVPINWNPSAWNTATLTKTGAAYRVLLNGTEILAFTDTWLNGAGKLGFHTYGTKKLDNFRLETPTVPTNATITGVANPSAGGTVAGTGTFAVGSTQTLTATANAGYTFTGWADGNTSNPRQIVVPVGGATYTASFAVVPPPDTQGPDVAVGGAVVATNGKSVTVSGTASDSGRGGNGVASVEVAGAAATGLPVSGDATANWTATIPVSAGAHAISIVATDSLGNPTTTPISVTVPSVISLSPGAHTAPAAGDSYTISVAANTTWTAASDQTWATVSPASGSGDGSIVVAVSANPATVSRTAAISVGGQAHSLTQSPFTPSRLISLAWSNNGVFGEVAIGSTSTAQLTISNAGNSSLTVAGITYPEGYSGNWSAGIIAAGAFQLVTVTFAPSADAHYVGGVSVNSDATDGVAATPVSGTGIAGSSNASAAHAVAGPGYVPGSTVTISNTLTYTGTATGLGWQVLLPAGWSYASGAGSEGDVKPSAGTTDLLEWAWTSIPASPVAFTYTLNVPASATGDKTLAALAIVRQGGSPIQALATPDPLTVHPVIHHAADTNKDWKISLLELTRVIELYNTRSGTARTGCYQVQDGTEDGFAPDSNRAANASVTLAHYHSADTNHDGKLSLLELTRAIEIYNYRSGTTRTGQYRAQTGTEDGFAPGPAA